jgi:CheY-like chemotaxis protein
MHDANLSSPDDIWVLSRHPVRYPTDSLHILVAEDDADLRAMLAASLRADGHRVSEAGDGIELLRLTSHEGLESGGYDVIVSDIVMPGVSGMGALMQLNYEPNAPPVVLITALDDPDIHLWAQQLGAVATFEKPFDLDDLKTVLLNVCASSARA